jgi:hypothetical protein
LDPVMPRYFFDIKNGHRLIDPAGLDCRNDQETIEKVAIIASQIAEHASLSEGRHVAVSPLKL